jgi:hypothetical protein
LDFGHFFAEVPESLHIGANRCISLAGPRPPGTTEVAANRHNEAAADFGDLANCHAEGRGFESLQPLFPCKSTPFITTMNPRMERFSTASWALNA